jgi:hypothetical protein
MGRPGPPPRSGCMAAGTLAGRELLTAGLGGSRTTAHCTSSRQGKHEREGPFQGRRDTPADPWLLWTALHTAPARLLATAGLLAAGRCHFQLCVLTSSQQQGGCLDRPVLALMSTPLELLSDVHGNESFLAPQLPRSPPPDLIPSLLKIAARQDRDGEGVRALEAAGCLDLVARAIAAFPHDEGVSMAGRRAMRRLLRHQTDVDERITRAEQSLGRADERAGNAAVRNRPPAAPHWPGYGVCGTAEAWARPYSDHLAEQQRVPRPWKLLPQEASELESLDAHFTQISGSLGARLDQLQSSVCGPRRWPPPHQRWAARSISRGHSRAMERAEGGVVQPVVVHIPHDCEQKHASPPSQPAAIHSQTAEALAEVRSEVQDQTRAMTEVRTQRAPGGCGCI